MPLFRVLPLLLLLVARPALGAEPASSRLPPALPRAEPPALARAPLEERRPVELMAGARGWVPLVTPADAASVATWGGAAAGVGFRTSPYFSLGVEGSALRGSGASAGGHVAFELAATGRVYLLEAGMLDPYLELALGYTLERTRGAAAAERSHGPSARAGGGLDLVLVYPLRIGASLEYREVVHFRTARCEVACRPRVLGGLVAGVGLTVPLGEPL